MPDCAYLIIVGVMVIGYTLARGFKARQRAMEKTRSSLDQELYEWDEKALSCALAAHDRELDPSKHWNGPLRHENEEEYEYQRDRLAAVLEAKGVVVQREAWRVEERRRRQWSSGHE